ncbi:hypothetical protein BGZ61DRAFT_554969 [Ilyonectria robusta]|uniref:uncharacterized protein n=1 Tax=Ilyonectria robusta TaxID=1079257 RepID=UPI001E8E558A|nr:uncharacterized protein BGZ61DRAFT_554969 [Ilyonectria robusta]KAH8675073.1 hypothetical protein BGZ61DRAFT_554969 [Ilyonectria robusta]
MGSKAKAKVKPKARRSGGHTHQSSPPPPPPPPGPTPETIKKLQDAALAFLGDGDGQPPCGVSQTHLCTLLSRLGYEERTRHGSHVTFGKSEQSDFPNLGKDSITLVMIHGRRNMKADRDKLRQWRDALEAAGITWESIQEECRQHSERQSRA